MNGTDNLIPFNKRTEEEQRRIATMGGKASGESRRRRKTFKEALLIALETEKDGKLIQDLGVEALIAKYINGDLEVFKTVRDTVGEKPVDKQVNVETDLEKYIKAVEDEKEF